MGTEPTTSTDRPVVMPLSGELDAADTDWIDELSGLFDAGHRHVVIDLLNVTFIDSSVARALMNAHRRVEADGWIRLVFTHHLIRRVIDICGLSGALPQYTTVAAALRASPARKPVPTNPPVTESTHR